MDIYLLAAIMACIVASFLDGFTVKGSAAMCTLGLVFVIAYVADVLREILNELKKRNGPQNPGP